MKITLRELKRLIGAAVAEAKAPPKFGAEKIRNLKESLLELGNAISELESEGFWMSSQTMTQKSQTTRQRSGTRRSML